MPTHEHDPPGPPRVEIVGEGMTLKQFIPEDAQPYYDLLQRNKDFLSQTYEGGTDDTGTKYQSVEEVLDSILNPVNPAKLRLGIWPAEAMIGSINLTPEAEHRAEIGYLLDEGATGHGYMTRALKLLCGHAFNDTGIKSLFADVYVGNEKSRRVLERAGFTHTLNSERIRKGNIEKLWVFELHKP